MLVEIIKGKDIYYPGEVVCLDDDFARELIAEGIAREYHSREEES